MENQLIPDEIIMNKIYYIRGQKVMLDFDLAALYEVETRIFNQTVKRNIESFLKTLCFNSQEMNGQRCHHNL